MKNKIRELRKELGMSQAELCEETNVSIQTIDAIENDKYDTTLSLAFNLAKCLNVTVDELFS
ncbi:helix-turn-helix transcriptional regulator [Macrococcus equi]|uniref:helix-turn-helix transcriptional regulator n=1 Tax=Macrococcus equi TaxID=3395462 RepID=UPI0039BE4601